jgi:hypothetical protein
MTRIDRTGLTTERRSGAARGRWCAHHAEALVCHRAAAGLRRDDAGMTDTACSTDVRAVELRLPGAISAILITKAYTLLVFAGIWALIQDVTDIVRAFQVRSLRS